MNSKQIILCAICLLWISVQVGISQPLTEIPYEYKLEAAEEAFGNTDYYNAVEWFEECYKETREIDLAFKISKCHFMLRDFARAERWYRRLIEKDVKNEYPEAKFDFGRVLKMNGKYEEAEEILNLLLQDPKGSEFHPLTRVEVEGIALAKSIAMPLDLQVENAGRKINSRYTESSPAIGPQGELYYIAFESDEIIKVTGKESEDYHAKIYQAKKDSKGAWQSGKKIGNILNRPGFHNSHVSFSPDGDRMFFTRSIVSGGVISRSELYYSESKGSGWGAPQPITSLNGDFINKHPSVGRLFGSDVLIFASNRPGGFGKLDLYYAPITREGSFGQPVNLGETVNSIGDDVTPFFGESELFFSSDGFPGLGGFDIFRTEWDGAKWTDPENMGKGYNTSVDDLYFTLGDDDSGFLVSNRDGTRSVKSKTCCDDIFVFNKKDIIIKLIASVFEEETPLPGATIKLYQKIGEDLGFPDVQENEEGNEFTFSLDSDKSYQVIVEKENYYPDTADFNTVGIRESKNFRGTFRLKPMPQMEDDSVVQVITRNEPIRLNNIYYDLDDDQILPEAEKDLDFVYDLMIKYPEMVIELSSHTDSRASNPYNIDLSQRRANSAKKYLEIRGIDGNRIRPVGYGETQILNKCVDGVECTEAEHRLNRRTEFSIIAGPQSIEVKQEVKKPSAAPTQGHGQGSFDDDDGDANLLGPPKLEFEKDQIDLGTIKQGEVKKEVLVFTNTGEKDLLIELATACECTELDWPRDPVKPGEKGTIEIVYNSEGKEGAQEVTVDVFANTENVVTQASFTVFVETIN